MSDFNLSNMKRPLRVQVFQKRATRGRRIGRMTWYVRLVWENGKILMHSQTYVTKEAADHAARELAGRRIVLDIGPF